MHQQFSKIRFATLWKFLLQYYGKIFCNFREKVLAKNNFRGNGNNNEASKRLRTIITEVAEKSDSLNAIGRSAINNVLYQTLQKASFLYLDKNGQKKELTANDILPTEPDNLASWLIVYEPVINLHQDPNKMFFDDKGGNNFLLTATDAILTNMHSGTPGYPSVVKFFNGAPKLTMQYNHCSICDTTWYGYPDWPHSNLPLALFCPFPCLGVINDYDGVQTTTRNPFLVLSPIRNAAKNFTIEHDWLRYNGGYLFDKPTGDIETPIQNNDEDTILHYGGYSLFVNGPKKESNPNKTVTAVYVRAVVLNNDNTFTTVPIAIELSTKNDLSPTEMIETDTAAMDFIQQYRDFETTLTQKYNQIKEGRFKYGVETEEDSDYTPIAFVERGLIDFSALLNKQKIYPKKIDKPLKRDFYLNNYDLSEYIKRQIDIYESEDVTPKIQKYIDILKETADSIINSENILTLKDGTKIEPEEKIETNWNKLCVYASKQPINSLYDIEDINYLLLYDEENPNEIIVPDAFTFTGEPIYLTVIIPIIIDIPVYINFSKDNIIYENQLMRAIAPKEESHISAVKVEKNCRDTTCDGTDRVECKHPDPDDPTRKLHPYDTVSCGHSKTLSNAYNITPKEITVQPSWYWNTSMFNSTPKLAALRNNGTLVDDGVTFVFNTISPFVSDNMSNAFDKITEYKFVTHRNGNNQPLQLATFMNDTKSNEDFLNFITPYYGNYPSAYSNPTGYFEKNDFVVQTSLELPQNATAVGSGRFCSGGKNDNLSIPVKLSGEITYGITTEESNKFKTYTPIEVEKTYKSISKSANPFTSTKQYWGIDPKGAANPMYLIQVQSDVIKFNPAFKMLYQDSNNPDSPYKDVWVLAAGEKTFISNDYVKIEVIKTDLQVTSQWSRDREDKIDENGNARTLPTAKSGSTIKASANGTTILVDVCYHVQDPNFVDPSKKATVQAKNDAKAKQFDDMVENIANTFKNNGVSFYSNMYQSITSGTLNKVTAPSHFKNLTEKTELKLAKPVTAAIDSQTKAYYIDVNGVADYTTTSRTINLNGQTIPTKDRWRDINAVRSENVLSELLEQNKGIDISGWYNEDYEGIIVVCKRYVITLNDLETVYAQIHPQHSDFQTDRNDLAQPLKFVHGPEILIPDKQYGIGVEYRLPTLIINGQTFDNIVIPSKPYLFDIRGSIYEIK
jgi:hypothetical protein